MKSHTFAIIAIHRLIVLIKNLIMTKMSPKLVGKSFFMRYRTAIAFYSVHIFVMSSIFLLNYIIPGLFKITNFGKCTRYWNDTFRHVFLILRSFLSPAITFFIYFICVPCIVVIFFIKNRNDKIKRKRFKPTIILTIKLFIYVVAFFL